jgi:hypothetical protein
MAISHGQKLQNPLLAGMLKKQETSGRSPASAVCSLGTMAYKFSLLHSSTGKKLLLKKDLRDFELICTG